MVTVVCSGLSGWDLEGQDRRIVNPRDGRPVGSDPVAASEEERVHKAVLEATNAIESRLAELRLLADYLP
ncbi:MAG: hypothetical protein J0H22_07510, partial [Actinobacteria bacterium]|nr:hypothetical protein [Actinomycetota bacterium]